MTQMPMDRAQTHFLELLRAGLWGVAVDPDDFRPDNTDWKAVLRIATSLVLLAMICEIV